MRRRPYTTVTSLFARLSAGFYWTGKKAGITMLQARILAALCERGGTASVQTLARDLRSGAQPLRAVLPPMYAAALAVPIQDERSGWLVEITKLGAEAISSVVPPEGWTWRSDPLPYPDEHIPVEGVGWMAVSTDGARRILGPIKSSCPEAALYLLLDHDRVYEYFIRVYQEEESRAW